MVLQGDYMGGYVRVILGLYRGYIRARVRDLFATSTMAQDTRL